MDIEMVLAMKKLPLTVSLLNGKGEYCPEELARVVNFAHATGHAQILVTCVADPKIVDDLAGRAVEEVKELLTGDDNFSVEAVDIPNRAVRIDIRVQGR